MRSIISAVIVYALIAVQAALAQSPNNAYRSHQDFADATLYGFSVAAVGDVDGDGMSEYAIGAPLAAQFRGAVYVYSGATGSLIRTFTGPWPFTLFGFSIAGVGDVDGDGKPDIAIGAPLDGSVQVRSIATSAEIHYFVFHHPLDLTGWAVAGAGDVDGDGVPDIIIGSPSCTLVFNRAGVVRVHSGATGALIAGTAGPAPHANLGFAVASIGDLNDNGAPEVLAGGPFGNTGVAMIFDGQTGTVIRALAGPHGFGRAVACAGDIDGDGYDDVIIGSPLELNSGGRVHVFSGATGEPLHAFNGSNQSQTGWSVASAGDIDGDGVPDILIGAPKAFYGIGRVLLRSGEDGTPLQSVVGNTVSDGIGYRVASVGDLDGDGTDDFLVGRATAGVGSAYVFRGEVANVPPDPPDPPGPPGQPILGFSSPMMMPMSSTNTAFITAADLNGNGAADIITLNRAQNRITVAYNYGNGSFQSPRSFPTGKNPSSLALLDANFDGALDLVVTITGENKIAFYRNLGPGVIFDSDIKFGKKPTAIVAADFNNDGLTDLAITFAGSRTVSVLRAIPLHKPKLAQRFQLAGTYTTGKNPIQIIAARLDDDPHLDLAVLNRDSKSITLYKNRGNGNFKPPKHVGLGAKPNAMALTDVNGSGRADVVIAFANGQLHMRWNNGFKFGPALKLLPVGPVAWVTTTDLDGNGAPDIIATIPSRQSVVIFTNSGVGFGFGLPSEHAAGHASKFVAIADVDGDGDADIICAKPSGANASVLTNTLVNQP